MASKAIASEWFIAGGTVPADALSYVKRPIDDELFELARAGEFCHVCTPRQMGKSSLMVRTAQRLREQGVTTAILDLAGIGANDGADRWYPSLLDKVRARAGLAVDAVAWWEQHAALPHVQRLTRFWRDVLVGEVRGRIVVFVDEIDLVLNLDFGADLIGSMRALYRARSVDPRLRRLSFVLLGFALPCVQVPDDPGRTQMGFGRCLPLDEFGRDDLAPLEEGLDALYPGQAGRIVDRIYDWTAGHPYLTQSLCRAAAESEPGTWTKERVDALVRRLFLDQEPGQVPHLRAIEEMIRTHPQAHDLLALYGRVIDGAPVREDGRSPVQNHLQRTGLLKVERGLLGVRNKLYSRAFDRAWTVDVMPRSMEKNG